MKTSMCILAALALAIPVAAMAFPNDQALVDLQTPEQAATLTQQLSDVAVQHGVQSMWDGAKPRVAKILGYMSCYRGVDPASGLQALILDPGVTAVGLPMLDMKRHNDQACLRVKSIGAVSRFTDRSFVFHVTFAADDSRETVDFRFVMADVRGKDWRMQYGALANPRFP